MDECDSDSTRFATVDTLASIEDDRRMVWKQAVAVGLFLLVGCKKENPLSCADGFCQDPNYPFCDVDGTLQGDPEVCITVEQCDPGELIACRADEAITCNSEGNNYDVVRCERGCDAGSGCRLCSPNETACTNGTVATCDASGAVVSSEKCALGCFEDDPRCREIDPSNTLASYLDMVTDPPDLDLSNAVFETDTGKVFVGNDIISVPNFLAPGAGSGASIRVFVVKSLKLRSAEIRVTGDPRLPPGAAIAILSRGDVAIEGELLVQSRAGSGECFAGNGYAFLQNGYSKCSGGGGGGHATPGGSGGKILNTEQGTHTSGGAMGPSSGTEGLIPLRGGCSGGYIDSTPQTPYTTGGGAIQISSRTRIDIREIVDVKGYPGEFFQDTTGALYLGGGGAGGSILLEAPTVVLGPNAKLIASGGDGAGCTTPNQYAGCSAGGRGATVGVVATNGVDIDNGNNHLASGGGGGGLGRIRIVTRDGNYTKDSGTLEEGSLTTGTVETR